MENPKYTFLLTGSFAARAAFPVYGDALSIDFDKESGQEFFRTKMNGKLKFIGGDYDDIMADPFDTKFLLTVEDASGATIFEGYFFKTDCEIDEAAKTVTVTPSPNDDYAAILAGWEKEFNLIKLAPEIERIEMSRRPVIQIYNRGSSRVTCILSGMCWEQECDVELDPGSFGFQAVSPVSPSFIFSTWPEDFDDWEGVPPVPATFDFNPGDPNNKSEVKDGYYVQLVVGAETWVTIRRAADDSIFAENIPPFNLITWPDTVRLWVSDSGSPLYGKHIILNGQPLWLYARILCSVTSLWGNTTQTIRDDDFVGKIPGYNYVLPYNPGGSYGMYQSFVIQRTMSNTPTDAGRSVSGQYYVQPVYPATAGYGKILPLCKYDWGDEFSLWWLSTPERDFDTEGRKAFTLRDAYPLHSVISVLLNEIGSGVTFAADEAYSDFLYAAYNSIKAASFNLYLTPKSNLLVADYTQAAQRGNITLKAIFEMLRSCFQCYWFIDNGKLRIEHIEYFKRGGSYVNPPSVGVNTTAMIYSRTGKSAAEGQQAYKFDKPETYSRIVFGWMDDVTEPFDGEPIKILAPWVQEEKSESVDVTNFTTDIDYLLINPGGISKDGFVLLCTQEVNGKQVVPFVNVYAGNKFTPSDLGEHPIEVLQNGYLAFIWLERYYLYNLPAPNYEIDGRAGVAIGTMRIKTQEVNFPAPFAPNLQRLVKTLIGDGQIAKLSINLQSLNCKATLNYGTP